jgi:hypothetical protein
MIWLLLLALLQPQIPGPHLEAHWQGHTLLVIASPGSLYLVGEAYGEQYVGMEAVTLRDRGVDARYNPTNYDYLELRNANGETVVSLPVPDKPPEVWLVILPIVARPAP